MIAPLAGGCQQSPAGLPVVKMKIGRLTCQIEVASTAGAEEKGLMQRDSMPDDHGMLFVFKNEQTRYFWMKNTRFPLDILFLNSRGRIMSIGHMQAYDLNETSSNFPAQYAIELNSGAAEKAGVKVGDMIDLPSEARAASRQ
ncbi:MAG TPA: DUF192 domain-containing protein [Tepidisphaeraceae bacterium]|nr:DUF192 domain-containing protein [Tepidisphaeraceae bacterium]